MQRFIFIITFIMISASNLFASQSVIIESDGYACMGEDKSRKQTEQVAIADAKRKATESAVSYITSETQVKDAMLERDLLSAYSRAQVKQLQELMTELGLGQLTPPAEQKRQDDADAAVDAQHVHDTAS